MADFADISYDIPVLPSPANRVQAPKVTGNFAQVRNPNETTKSDVSVATVNLELLNQRNQHRLARLGEVDPLEGSVFRLTDRDIQLPKSRVPSANRNI